MQYDCLEEKMMAACQRLKQNVLVPNDFTFDASADSKFYQSRKWTKILSLAVCIVLIGIVSVSAFTGNFYFIPGLGTFFHDDPVVTHSIEKIIEIESGGFTHKVLSAYIMKGRIYFDILYYPSDVGAAFDGQHTDYQVYYNGQICGDEIQSFGSAIHLSYNMPETKRGQEMEVTLYSNHTNIADIVLYPIHNTEYFNQERPYAVAKDIVLAADVQTQGNQTQVFVSAILPKDANRTQLVNQCRLGFSESSIYIQDSSGQIYRDCSMEYYDESLGNYVLPLDGDDAAAENLILHRSYHFFYFDIPENIREFTIVIPQITYASKDNESIVEYGPWEIHAIR